MSAADVLARLAVLPATSFHEQAVARVIEQVLAEIPVPVEVDAHGNLVAHYQRGSSGQSFALVAHMDHPGFELAGVAGSRCRALLLGGVVRDYIAPGVPVRIYAARGNVSGRITGGLEPAGSSAESFFEVEADGPVEPGDWGVWDMPDFRADGPLLHLRAADDLAGCAAVLEVLRCLTLHQAPGDVYGVFTRAEEVGLLGATLVAQAGSLPRGSIVVSVESSRALPGAASGEGPVIRAGDFRRTFAAEAEAFLLAGRDSLLRENAQARVQRQLLSGGTCEATAFSLLGYRSTGVAIPLGNYHNMGPEGRLVPETIHTADLEGAVDLLLHAVQASGPALEESLRRRYGAVAEEHRQRLRETARRWSGGR